VRNALPAFLVCVASVVGGPAPLAAQERVIDVRSSRPPAGNSFEALWGAYRRAQAAGDSDNAGKLFREIRRLRTERNVRSLEPFALALSAEGSARLAQGDRSGAEEAFTFASGLDPHLPDAYLGLAQARLKRGPLGILPAVHAIASALTARLPTAEGQYDLLAVSVPVVLLALFALVWIVGLALLLRHGTLLLHDLEEAFGAPRGRAMALAVHAVLLFLPSITFQGYAWLPFWWLALLFAYFNRIERVVAVVLVFAGLGVGPVTALLQARVLAEGNPIFAAAVTAVEGGPDGRAIAILEQAAANNPDDHDLLYLLGLQYKKAGRYDEAASVYRDRLRADPDDRIALNNLGNVEFSRGEFPAAIARYKQASEAATSPHVAATLFYNLQLAHLQRFEYQPAEEARSQAERLAGGLVRSYDRLWRYDKGDYAVVDLSLTDDEVLTKFSGTAQGIGVKNVAGTQGGSSDLARLAGAMAPDRFVVFVGVFVLVILGLSRWRGSKMFTMRCLKCGTPFCKHCHLGAAAAGLCTQCHHLFVVRDGVSGPARNQKLLEVQKEDERRERVFRVLSLLSPGAGHIYAHRTLAGFGLSFLWYLILSAVLLAGRVFPVTAAPGPLLQQVGLGAAAVTLLVVYVVANRARPDFEVAMPAPRRGVRRS
jgi:tetratricopeptide (TPR) repeat protein